MAMSGGVSVVRPDSAKVCSGSQVLATRLRRLVSYNVWKGEVGKRELRVSLEKRREGYWGSHIV